MVELLNGFDTFAKRNFLTDYLNFSILGLVADIIERIVD